MKWTALSLPPPVVPPTYTSRIPLQRHLPISLFLASETQPVGWYLNLAYNFSTLIMAADLTQRVYRKFARLHLHGRLDFQAARCNTRRKGAQGPVAFGTLIPDRLPNRFSNWSFFSAFTKYAYDRLTGVTPLTPQLHTLATCKRNCSWFASNKPCPFPSK